MKSGMVAGLIQAADRRGGQLGRGRLFDAK